MHKKVYEKLMSNSGFEPLDMNCSELKAYLKAVLDEDARGGDITSELVLPADNPEVEAFLVVRHDMVVAGLPLAQEFFRMVDESICFSAHVSEGDLVAKGQKIADIKGPMKSILKAERVALNLLQHLCGIATDARKGAEIAAGHGVKIVDTRKTLPLMRRLQKYAVTVGGGKNHRFDLSDGILIKDNHINATDRTDRINGIKTALARAKSQSGFLVEIEVESFDEARVAVEAGADIIMLDNMPPEKMKEATAMIDGRALVEASGGITLETLEAVAASGIDYISVGSLTHSVKAADISLEIQLL